MNQSMRTIGLLGGMSWQSSLSYYRFLNEAVARRLSGLHSASIAMVSVDFAGIEDCQRRDDWAGAGEILAGAARQVEAAGADFLLIGTNTMHCVAGQIEAAISIPLLHIADATGETLISRGHKRVGLLGTAFTMQQPFYRERLSARFGLDVMVPDEPARREVHRIIYEELCQGQFLTESRQRYAEIIETLRSEGAEAVILGCTEIGLLVRPEDAGIPLIDTALVHAEKAVDMALEGL